MNGHIYFQQHRDSHVFFFHYGVQHVFLLLGCNMLNRLPISDFGYSLITFEVQVGTQMVGAQNCESEPGPDAEL